MYTPQPTQTISRREARSRETKRLGKELKCSDGGMRPSGKFHRHLTEFILTQTELQLLKTSSFTAQLHKLSTVMQDSEDQSWANIGYANRPDDAGAHRP
jgi:hypothetical protein